jgi:hypothetical protein
MGLDGRTDVQVELVTSVNMIGMYKNKIALPMEIEGLAVPTLDVGISEASTTVVAVSGGIDAPHALLVLVSVTRAMVRSIIAHCVVGVC